MECFSSWPYTLISENTGISICMGNKPVSLGEMATLLNELRTITKVETNAEVINEAVTLYAKLIQLTAGGDNLYYGKNSAEAVPLYLPVLDRIKLMRDISTKPTVRLKKPTLSKPNTGDQEPYREPKDKKPKE